MRDLFITMIVLGTIPLTLVRPFVGLVMWTWLSLMTPHRLTWGFAYDYPFVQLVALVTMGAWLFYRHKRSLPPNAPMVLFISFTLWGAITTVFAYDLQLSFDRFVYVMKMFALAYFIILTVRSREEIHILAWVVAISIGFFSIKGGVFSIITGGNHRVFGPLGSFIADNNQMALATLMVMPLMRYLQLNSADRLLRIGLGFALVFSIISVLGSYSRGAFLGLGAMLFVLVMKSRRKLMFGVIVLVGLGGSLMFLPEQWWDRMATIETYEEDASAQGRFSAWGFAIDVAVSRPLTGGGFDIFSSAAASEQYRPGERRLQAHSIIFQVLGEHGFIGLFLFLMLGVTVWTTGSRIERQARDRPDLHWAGDLAAMIKVGLVGYFAAGLFLNLAFFDLLYVMLAMMIVTADYVTREIAAAAGPARAPWRQRPAVAPQLSRPGLGDAAPVRRQ